MGPRTKTVVRAIAKALREDGDASEMDSYATSLIVDQKGYWKKTLATRAAILLSALVERDIG